MKRAADWISSHDNVGSDLTDPSVVEQYYTALKRTPEAALRPSLVRRGFVSQDADMSILNAQRPFRSRVSRHSRRLPLYAAAQSNTRTFEHSNRSWIGATPSTPAYSETSICLYLPCK
jgi:hypothetical protein